jgi:hypothetical protein
MRLSAEKDDPNYNDAGIFVSVFLNGVKLKDCVTADEEAGEVVCLAKSGSNYILDGEEIKKVTRHGTVRIEVPLEYRKFFS